MTCQGREFWKKGTKGKGNGEDNLKMERRGRGNLRAVQGIVYETKIRY